MGIKASFSGDFTAIELRSLADDMLAEVVVDHARDRFADKNRVNAAIAGVPVPFQVSFNGRTVARGTGDLLPKAPLMAAMPKGAAARRIPVIDIAWRWESLQPSAIRRAIEVYVRADTTLGRIQNAAEFARLILNDERATLFRLLLQKYAAHRYPRLAAGISDARKFYRIYRLVRLGDRLLRGGNSENIEASVLAWIASELRERSPVLSGAYRDAHALYADGGMIADAAEVTEDMEIPEAEEFSFGNDVPYARKIELGVTRAGRAFVIHADPHIYENVADDAASRYGEIADIRFEMRAVLGGEQVRQSRAASTRPPRAASGIRESRLGRVHGQTAHNAPDARFPAIVVRFK